MPAADAFPADARALLLQVKGVGPAVLARLEQMGFCRLDQLAAADAGEVVASAAALTGSTCWRNSPQARAAVSAAIAAARAHGGPA